MKSAKKLFFTIGPYDGLISYTSRKTALANKLPEETIVSIDLNQSQQKILNQARQEAFDALG